jgi:hypothetical protein
MDYAEGKRKLEEQTAAGIKKLEEQRDRYLAELDRKRAEAAAKAAGGMRECQRRQ